MKQEWVRELYIHYHDMKGRHGKVQTGNLESERYEER